MVIYFDNDNQKTDRCSGETYSRFIDYAFEEADYFMLVYVNYYGKGYSHKMKFYMQELKPFLVKSRNNPQWPGVLQTACPNTTYKITFYKTSYEAKKFLKLVNQLSDWSAPTFPQDLAFFKGNCCWFYSVGHEKIGAFIHATNRDIAFVESNKLASFSKMFKPKNNYYDAYNEELEPRKKRNRTGDGLREP